MITNTITVYIAACLLASIKRNNVITILLIRKINFIHSIYKGVLWFGDHLHSNSTTIYQNEASIGSINLSSLFCLRQWSG